MEKKLSFTLVELLVIIAILLILIAIAIPNLRFFQKESDLENSAQEIINTLRLAQNKTLASEGASQYGVYFDNLTSPNQYTLFKGASYASRNSSFDEIHKLPSSVEISEINLGGSEVAFVRVTGIASQSGKISLRLKTDPSKIKTIAIQSSGQITLSEEALPTDTDHIEDSRHVHFDYSRVIDTATEKLTLTFEGPVTKEIIISENLKDGQIYWEGEIDVLGQTQKIKIHTHRLNNPDSQFCIHRDRRYNNKALTITISGDGSGSLISYTTDGQESRGTSIFLATGEAGDPQRQ